MRRLASCLLLAVPFLASVSSAGAQPVEDDVDREFNRLEARYTGNKTMIATLAKLRRSWRDYQGTQCFFEKTAAAGGEAFIKGAPPEAGQAHRRCLARTGAEMKSTLARY